MTKKRQDCVAIPRIKKYAKDALEVTEKIHRQVRKHEIPEKLELGLRKIEEDLTAILMDNHRPH